MSIFYATMIISTILASHAEHDWLSYDETAECTSETDGLVTFRFISAAGDVITGVESRPDNIK